MLVADWMGHPASEVATSVAQPLTGALQAVPGVTAVRAASMSGMAYLDVTFSSVSRLPAGRAAILERVARLSDRLPATVRVRVGPQASSTGWVYQYALVDPARHESPLALRRFQDEVPRSGPRIDRRRRRGRRGRRRRRAGGRPAPPRRAAPPPAGLQRRGVRGARGVRDGGRTRSLAAVEALAAAPVGGDPSTGPSRLADVARVGLTRHPGSGFADLGGALEAVGGIVIAERDADLPSLIREVRRVLAEKRAAHPGRLQIVPVHDRLALVEGVGRTLWRALAEEVAVAALVILVFLLHGKSALVPLLTLPLILLLTFLGMRLLGLPATLMSLGGMAIALGMAVDADVVALEACHRRLEDPRRRRAGSGALGPGGRRRGLRAGHPDLVAHRRRSPSCPCWPGPGRPGGCSGRWRSARRWSSLAAALVTLTVAPALRDRLLRGRVPAERDNPLVQALVRLYRPFVQFALDRPRLTLATAALAVASCLPILPRLGGEFLPRIDEGDLLFMPTTLAGVPPEEAMRELRAMDRALASFPEVATVFGKVGRADSATDPAPYSMAETIIRLRPGRSGREPPPALVLGLGAAGAAPGARLVLARAAAGDLGGAGREARPGGPAAGLDPGLDGAGAGAPGHDVDGRAHRRSRVRIVAPSVERLDVLGAAIRREVLRVPGTRSAVLESQGGETWPRLRARSRRARAARRGPGAGAVDGGAAAHRRPRSASSTLGGERLPSTRRGRRRRRHAPAGRAPARADGSLARASAGDPGEPVAARAAGRRRVRGRSRRRPFGAGRARLVPLRRRRSRAGAGGADLAAYVERLAAARPRRVRPALATPARRPASAGSWRDSTSSWRQASAGCGWIVPLVVLSMLGLLCWQFRSLTEALIVLLSVPFALVGSFWTLFLLGYHLSAPVWVGLLSVLGLAMQTGVVMVVYIDEAFHRRVRAGRLATRDDIVAAHAEGTVERLRPKLMTVTTMAASLLPLLWAEGAGAEILRRVAAPMIGGLVTSAFLTLEVLPVRLHHLAVPAAPERPAARRPHRRPDRRPAAIAAERRPGARSRKVALEGSEERRQRAAGRARSCLRGERGHPRPARGCSRRRPPSARR